jgi:hypothetical protein
MDTHCVSIVAIMEKKAALRIRIEPGLHKAFMEVCKMEGKPASQVLREFMRAYIRERRTSVQRDLFFEGEREIEP